MPDKTLEEFTNELKQHELDSIDKKLRMIEKKLAPFNDLIELRNRLTGARRALLSERATTNGGGRGLTQEEVVKAMLDEGRMTVHAISEKLSATTAVVRGHLNRGKDERFEKHGDNTWSLRDPESEDEGDEDED